MAKFGSALRAGCIIALAWLMAATSLAAPSAAAAGSRPFDVAQLKQADQLIEKAVAEHRCPGAVLLVGRGDDVLYRKAYGNRSVEPVKTPMTTDTIFDMASLTKAMATAPSIMILADRGKLKIGDPVAKYLPAFGQNGKQGITIEDLLLHRGGLPPDDDLSDYSSGPAEAWKRICALPPQWPPGSRFAYSDVGFVVLAKVVEAISGQGLDQFTR